MEIAVGLRASLIAQLRKFYHHLCLIRSKLCETGFSSLAGSPALESLLSSLVHMHNVPLKLDLD